MSERALQDAVIECAKWRGWETYHTYDSRRSSAGFPDLVLVRDCVIFVELKSTTGRLTKEQIRWREDLEAAGAVVLEWRPVDWYSGAIERILV